MRNAILKWPKCAGICEAAATILKGSREAKEEVLAWLFLLLLNAVCVGQGGEPGDTSKANYRPTVVGEFLSTDGEEK